MTKPLVHLETPTPRALCGALPAFWTRDILAVTCPRCEALIEAQPA